ncbi:MAG: 4Fe-4S binding protein [Candidatus Saccharibacteria bacterium]
MMELKEAVRAKCRQLDIPIMGVAPVERWDEEPFTPWVPPDFRPRNIYPESRSVIVIGLPIDLPVLETAPSIFYHELYNTVNRLLDEDAYRIALMLNEMGHPSIFTPRDGYGSLRVLQEDPLAFFSHRHAAYLAGLGTFGINNMLLTPKYGPRIRLNSILTTAELPPDPIMKKELCVRCMRCAQACPAHALEEGDYPHHLTRKDRCTDYNVGLADRHISPCGMCIKICPVGKDREAFGRKDMRIYRDRSDYEAYHRAWEHVRAHGGRLG